MKKKIFGGVAVVVAALAAINAALSSGRTNIFFALLFAMTLFGCDNSNQLERVMDDGSSKSYPVTLRTSDLTAPSLDVVTTEWKRTRFILSIRRKSCLS